MDNLFKIEETKPINKTRGVYSAIREQLSKTMVAMEVSNIKSFLIPVSLVSNMQASQNLIQQTRDMIRSSISSMKNCQYTCRAEKDNDGKYLGCRVYRIN